MTKWLCRQCDWTGAELLRAPNPFEPEFEVFGCPACKDVTDIVGACDVLDCTNQSTTGVPTDDGYMRYCSKHFGEAGVMNLPDGAGSPVLTERKTAGLMENIRDDQVPLAALLNHRVGNIETMLRAQDDRVAQAAISTIRNGDAIAALGDTVRAVHVDLGNRLSALTVRLDNHIEVANERPTPSAAAPDIAPWKKPAWVGAAALLIFSIGAGIVALGHELTIRVINFIIRPK